MIGFPLSDGALPRPRRHAEIRRPTRDLARCLAGNRPRLSNLSPENLNDLRRTLKSANDVIRRKGSTPT